MRAERPGSYESRTCHTRERRVKRNLVGPLGAIGWPPSELATKAATGERKRNKRPSRPFRPLQAAPGLVDGWLRPPGYSSA